MERAAWSAPSSPCRMDATENGARDSLLTRLLLFKSARPPDLADLTAAWPEVRWRVRAAEQCPCMCILQARGVDAIPELALKRTDK